MTNFTGVIPILATPFHDDDSIDHASLERMIGFFSGMGVTAVTLLGVLGESNRLTDSERAALIATAVRAAGKLPVIVGCSHTGTAATIALSKDAAQAGAAAVMIAPSRQPVPNDEVVFAYYQQVAAGAGRSRCPAGPSRVHRSSYERRAGDAHRERDFRHCVY